MEDNIILVFSIIFVNSHESRNLSKKINQKLGMSIQNMHELRKNHENKEIN